MLNLILFGAPGSGKGTQAEKLIDKFNLMHLSTGDLLRNEIKLGTPLGLQAQNIMTEGKLVPDEVVIGMINNHLNNNKNSTGFLFDGFPRTLPQATALDNLLKTKQQQINLMIFLDVHPDELLKRLLKRGEISKRPDDVNETIIKKRITEYNTNTHIVAEHYQEKGILFTLNGIGTIDEIFNKIVTEINKLIV